MNSKVTVTLDDADELRARVRDMETEMDAMRAHIVQQEELIDALMEQSLGEADKYIGEARRAHHGNKKRKAIGTT